MRCPAWPDGFSYTNRQHRPSSAKIPGATLGAGAAWAYISLFPHMSTWGHERQ